jgi:hypothetical protein
MPSLEQMRQLDVEGPSTHLKHTKNIRYDLWRWTQSAFSYLGSSEFIRPARCFDFLN